jgi:hypothetical protein
VNTLVSILLTAAMIGAAVWLLAVYTLGNAWYASRVGRALVTLASSVLFIELYSLARRLLGWPAWTAQVEQGIILIALLLLCGAFTRERREVRRRQSAIKSHRVDKE